MDTNILNEQDIRVAVEQGLFANSIRLRVTAGHGDALRMALREAGIEHNTGFDFSIHAPEIIHAVITNETFWPSVAAALRGFLGRHRGKRTHLRVNGTNIDFDTDGYSADDAEKMIETTLRELRTERVAASKTLRKPKKRDV